jgi:hypothetical protein
MLASIHRWIIHHDESRLFSLLYISLAVILSLWISLFWLVVVVFVHLVFEWISQRHRGHSWSRTVLESLWELKLDLGLIVFALALALYLDFIFGLAGLGATARIAPAAGRFIVWKQVLRGVLLSVDDAARVARALLTKRRRSPSAGGAEHEDLEPRVPVVESMAVQRWGSWASAWGRGDRFAVGFGLLCLGLLVFSPLLSPHDLDSALQALAAELHPLPSDS